MSTTRTNAPIVVHASASTDIGSVYSLVPPIRRAQPERMTQVNQRQRRSQAETPPRRRHVDRVETGHIGSSISGSRDHVSRHPNALTCRQDGRIIAAGHRLGPQLIAGTDSPNRLGAHRQPAQPP